MDVVTPRSLDEALRLKAEHPEARPIQGGTDVMIELNFDRTRPAALLDLNAVEELRGWTRRDGSVRLGAGLTYTEAMREELAELLPALAEASPTGDVRRTAAYRRHALRVLTRRDLERTLAQ